MLIRCLVPNCSSRYNSDDGQKLGDPEKISLFALPKDSAASNGCSTLVKETASERLVAVSERNASASEQPLQNQSLQTDMAVPNDPWCSTTLSGRGIIFMELSPDLTSIVRRVVVYENLDVKVWLNEIPVQIEHFTKLSCTEKIPCLLEIVSSMELSSSLQSINQSQGNVTPYPGENGGPEPFVELKTNADCPASPVDTFEEQEAVSLRAVHGTASCELMDADSKWHAMSSSSTTVSRPKHPKKRKYKKRSVKRRMAELRMRKVTHKQKLHNNDNVERIEEEIDRISVEETKCLNPLVKLEARESESVPVPDTSLWYEPLVKLEASESESVPDTSLWRRPSPVE